MKQINRSALLLYSCEQMFDVVNSVEDYPEFLPWCDGARVISGDNCHVIAEILVARSGVKRSFTTKNYLCRPDTIELHLVEGPFRMLSGNWSFSPLGNNGCRVEMQLAFDLDSTLAGTFLSKVFDQGANTLVDAFCDRADHIYGEVSD